MPEFMFRNLSVKLNPAGGNPQLRSRDRTNFYPDCTPWFTYFECVLACSGSPSIGQACAGPDTTDAYCVDNTQAPCDLASRAGGFIDDVTNVIIPPGTDIGTELSRLKVSLQSKMDAVDARIAEVGNAARPRSVEQIDDLKSQLLAAVAELDEQRAQMEGGQPPASG
jgi:hypothetical protein